MIKMVDELVKKAKEQDGDPDTIMFSETAWEIFKEEMTHKIIKEECPPLTNTDELITLGMMYMGLVCDVDPAIEDGKVYVIKSIPAKKVKPLAPFYIVSLAELQVILYQSIMQGITEGIAVPKGTYVLRHWMLWGNC